MIRRIAITGGPGAGKTTCCQRLSRDYPFQFTYVPEAATQVYQALQTRWDLLDRSGRCDLQRRIYRLQISQEAELASQSPGKILLTDRGTVDGAAYWPDGPDDYWRELQTTLAEQLDRYEAVLWLQTSAVLGCYDGHQSNPCRREQPDIAIELGLSIRRLWSGHPRLHIVEAHDQLDHKYAAVRDIVLAGVIH